MKKQLLLKVLLTLCLCALLTIGAGCATSQKSPQAASGDVAAEVTDIQVLDNMVIIKGSRHFIYTLYSTDDPYKVAVEVPEIVLGKFAGRIASDKQGITEIVSQQSASPKLSAKLLIGLQTPAAVVPTYKDNVLTLEIKGENAASSGENSKALVQEIVSVAEVKDTLRAELVTPQPVAEEKTPEPTPEAAPEASSAKGTVISGIELKKFPDSVKVMIIGNGTMIPNVFPLDERIVVDIPQVTLETKVPASVIAPVKGIRAGKHKDKVRLVIDLKEKTNYDVTAMGSTIVVSLQKAAAAPAQPAAQAETAPAEPVIAAASAAAAHPAAEKGIEITGDEKRISLDFQDADIIPIFRLLADISGYNFVVSPEIKGRITLKLANVPWTQALDLILRTFSLEKMVDGNVIRIVTTTALQKEHKDQADVKKAAAEAGELKTKIFPVNYADLSKLKTAIDAAKIMSSRGNITLDERGSAIIANDLEPNLEKIGLLVAEVDRESMQARQVMIEARIVEINSDYTKELGVQWGANFAKPGGSGTTIIGSTALTGGPGLTGNNFLVNLPAAAGAGSGGAIGIGYISKAANLNLDLQLSAMEQIKKGKVVSSPRIMTMNNEKANIKQGRSLQVPITTADKVDLKEVPILLSLDVTPRIAPGGAILMNLKITKDEFLGLISVGDASGVDMTKNSIETSVLVNNSDTVVIGGIFKQSVTGQNDGVPGLARIPILGWLFKKEKEIETNNELVVFITPKLVEFSALK